MVIQELDFDICHRSGKSNFVTNALSRNPLPIAEVLHIEVKSQPQHDSSDVETLQQQDEELVMNAMLRSSPWRSHALIEGVLYHENPDVSGVWQIAVPKALRETLLK